ncbi:MAG: alpha-mannosidase [Anaerolineales bacterium]|nr:alpha-mannosidase [Anaerolineales bacterium]
MALPTEWRMRVENWLKELPRHFYRPLGSVALSGFTTTSHLSLAQALTHSFAPVTPGARWGAKWEYGWFQGEIELPPAAAGHRIVLCVDVGAESLVWVNGQIEGARDRQHREITLADRGVAGARYQVVVEGYAGHGPQVVYAGPTPLGRDTVPEPDPTQVTLGETTYGIWEELAYQLWLDVVTLYEVRENLDPLSLRVQEIDQALRDFTVIVDFELPYDEMMATMQAARERLSGPLACVNGSTTPTMFAFGHAHIDVAWLWPLAETERKTARTFGNQLALMAEYPEYRFLQSQPHLYHMLKARYPELYERVKTAIRDGQVIPDGSTWVEPDTNVPSGESLIRQFVYGKRFYQDEFGVDCELLWLPDVFGYSGALPQIMRGCGVRFFSTQKIFWAYHGGDMFPYNTFTWEGIDGSEVLVHLHNDYNSTTNPAAVIGRWNERVQKDGFSTRLMPFGYGDGGGGPTRNHLEFARRAQNLEGVPKVRLAGPMDYFRDQQAKGWPAARYVGELYFQAHRGTYTSQARTKRGNRKSELALREAELWAAAAGALKGFAFPADDIAEAWISVLLNQFHDILPGSSIHRVYEQAEAAYADVITRAERVTQEATAALVSDAAGVVVFNSLSWPRTALVPLPAGTDGATDPRGVSVPTQTLSGQPMAEVRVPACGWTTLRPASAASVENTLHASPRLLENELLRVEFNPRGEITRLFDKEAKREVAAGLCNSFRMFKDVPTNWDAWDIDSSYALNPVELPEPAEIEVVAQGPLVAAIRVSRKLHHSPMTQEIRLARGSRRIEFYTTIDWQEAHKLLKVAFAANVHANEAIHEIQFGHIRRPNHQSRQFDADRFEVSNHKWTALAEENHGVAVLNDCKYGVNVLGNTISLTLLKAALAPDQTADRGEQTFSYAFYAWNGPFFDSRVVQEAYELNVPALTAAGASDERSLFWVDAPNVIADTVKPAEDRSGDMIVRLYEAKRASTSCVLNTSLAVASVAETDMLEHIIGELPIQQGQVPLTFRPFEVKTLRLKVRPA